MTRLLGLVCSAIAWVVCPVLAKTEDYVHVLLPQHGQVFAWSRTKPDIRIEVRSSLPDTAQRPFVTANVLDAAGRLVDRVALYDDGTHGDPQPGDGVFCGSYQPATTGEYQIKARLQWTEAAASRERWTTARPFAIEQVPYPHLISPTPGQRVAHRVQLRARLLSGPEGQIYEPQGETVRVRCWTEPKAEVRVPGSAGRDFSIRVEFAQPGNYRLFVTTAVQRRGQWIETEPESVQVVYAKPSFWTAWLGGILLLLAIFWPGKSVRLYQHNLNLRSSDGSRLTVEIAPKLLQPVKHTVGDISCSTTLPNAEGTLFTLVARPGEKFLHVLSDTDKNLPDRILPEPSTSVMSVQGWKVYYQSADIKGQAREPFYKFTRLKKLLLTLGMILLAYNGWTYWQFQHLLSP